MIVNQDISATEQEQQLVDAGADALLLDGHRAAAKLIDGLEGHLREPLMDFITMGYLIGAKDMHNALRIAANYGDPGFMNRLIVLNAAALRVAMNNHAEKAIKNGEAAGSHETQQEGV